MKKMLWMMVISCLFLSGCGAFHSKQPVDDNYYKKTQSVPWPDGK